VNDQTSWEQALTTAAAWYPGLPAAVRAELDGLLDEIMRLKEGLLEPVTASGGPEVCRTCAGECCLLGKYHFSVLDLLAYLRTGLEPPVPDFSAGPACPYSDATGCTMPPGYRPVTCVIFNCQLIDDRLTELQRQTLHGLEGRLRTAVARAGRIHDIRIDRPLLLSCS